MGRTNGRFQIIERFDECLPDKLEYRKKIISKIYSFFYQYINSAEVWFDFLFHFQFQLLACNEGNPSIESDSILIRIRLVERLTPTPTPPRANRPTTGALPARAGSPDDLSVGGRLLLLTCSFILLYDRKSEGVGRGD